MTGVVAVRHVHFEDLGTFEDAARARGLAVRYLEAGADDLSRLDPLAPDVLVVLGGPIGATEERFYPFLADELALLEARLRADRPTIGICLGAQLMARVLGARVYAGPAKEIGWAPISLTEAGRASSLAPLGADGGTVLHWHGDTFDLPGGATHLAASEMYPNQAFSYGDGALALQFHPEADARGLERWFIGHACEIAAAPGVTVARLRADTARFAGALARRARRCFEDWLSRQGL